MQFELHKYYINSLRDLKKVRKIIQTNFMKAEGHLLYS